MQQLTENQRQILDLITEEVMSTTTPNSFLVQIIEHAGSFLNLQTRTEYQKSEGVSYNTAKKYRENKEIFGVNFVIDNE